MSFSVINIILSMIGTILDTVIINGFIKLRPIDKEISIVFKISKIYLHLFNLTYLFLIDM